MVISMVLSPMSVTLLYGTPPLSSSAWASRNCLRSAFRKSFSLPAAFTPRKGRSFFLAYQYHHHHHQAAASGRHLCAVMMMVALPENEVVHDVLMAGVGTSVAMALLRLWEVTAKLGVDQKLNRKLAHISIGLVFMLFWPLFSDGIQAPFLAAFAPGINIFRMLLLGLGIMKSEAVVKSMSRQGDYRELLKGPLYYACTITFVTIIFWRTSPIGIAAICNLCAGDGVADIVGRRLGRQKLPYNLNKSYAGSIAMASAGFITSIMYMHYFSLFGLMEQSWGVTFGFFLVSLATAVVESLPISSQLDDNLTVPVTSLLVGSCVF